MAKFHPYFGIVQASKEKEKLNLSNPLNQFSHDAFVDKGGYVTAQ